MEQVGQGGMAVVFRAHDERLNRQVALKVLPSAASLDEKSKQRFLRESQAAAAVDHPHIIPIFEAGNADGLLFIAMRYVAGGDVRKLIQMRRSLSSARAASIISPIASALDAAHDAGLVHRDVKPENMLLDVQRGRPSHVYLSDFGLSKGTLSSSALTGKGMLVGTPDYIAPERIAGETADGRVDQYALACVAFELLSGQSPFRRDDDMLTIYAHANEPPPRLTACASGFLPDIDVVLTKALAKNPADRYTTCGEFADAVRSALRLSSYDYESSAGLGERRPAAMHMTPEVIEAVEWEVTKSARVTLPKEQHRQGLHQKSDDEYARHGAGFESMTSTSDPSVSGRSPQREADVPAKASTRTRLLLPVRLLMAVCTLALLVGFLITPFVLIANSSLFHNGVEIGGSKVINLITNGMWAFINLYLALMFAAVLPRILVWVATGRRVVFRGFR